MTPIANHYFQAPNIYIDVLLPLLSSSEFAVLMYAARAILGWQANKMNLQANISLAKFENGDDYNHGCGLSRPTIVNALVSLVEFGVLKRINGNRQLGQRWELVLDDELINVEGLRARMPEAVKSKRATPKAKTVAKPKTIDTPKVAIERAADPVFDAIAKLWYEAEPENKAAVKAVSPKVAMLRKRLEAHQPDLTVAILVGFVNWYRREAPGMALPSAEATVSKWLSKWAKAKQKFIKQVALSDQPYLETTPMFGAMFQDGQS